MLLEKNSVIVSQMRTLEKSEAGPERWIESFPSTVSKALLVAAWEDELQLSHS